MNSYTRGVIKLIILIGFSLLCLVVFSNALRPNDLESKDRTSIKVDGFYALEDNSLNVLFLGSSHAYNSFNPSILWKNTGLTSYVFGGQCQPIEVTYYYLKEALKHQSPELVVLDIFALANQSNVCQTEGTYRVNIQDLDLNQNKIDAYKLLENQSLIENIFDISLYHGRITEIKLSDLTNAFSRKFDPDFGYTINYPANLNAWDRELLDVKETKMPEQRKTDYFIKITNLLKESNIPLLLVKTPYYIDESDSKIYNSIWKFADENDIPTLDFNTKLSELKFVFELDGDSWHTNSKGALKITNYLSEYLLQNTEFTNKYTQYSDEYNVLYAKTLYAVISREYSLIELLTLVKSSDVTVLINYDKKGILLFSDEELALLKEMGFDLTLQKQSIVFDKGVITLESPIKKSIADNSYALDENGDFWINDQFINNQETSLKFVVIDNKTGYVVDNFQTEFGDKTYILRR